LAVGRARTAGTKQRSISYRADAVILLLGFPIFSRAGVGGGYAEAWPETTEDGISYFLRFAGCSWPERAHGLDRAGYIEENVQGRNGAVISAEYFGLMTSSTEETAEQARRALAANKGDLSFSAIQGTSRPGVRESASAIFGYPRGTGERDWRNLLETAHRQLGAVQKRISGNAADPAGGAMPTFLYCVQHAIESHETRLKQTFVYGDRQMWLETEKAADPHMNRELGADGAVFKLTGAVRKHKEDSPAVFRIWFEAGNPLPLRIDYQPRSFLRLSFTRDAHAGLGLFAKSQFPGEGSR
jgi:hypothetical protein